MSDEYNNVRKKVYMMSFVIREAKLLVYIHRDSVYYFLKTIIL